MTVSPSPCRMTIIIVPHLVGIHIWATGVYMNHAAILSENKDFSIVLGGPFFQLLRKAHLTGNSLELLKKRVLVISMVAWLPLLVLSLVEGHALPGSTKLPFLYDWDVHVRFLVALPLFIAAERVVHRRMVTVINQFQIRDLVPESSILQFNKAFSSALKWRNSVLAESLIVVVIYGIGYNFVWKETAGIDALTWYAQAQGEGLSLAGIWFRYLSLPIFQFLFLRWYYRIFIWGKFLFQISRIRLNLRATHPDNVGGLGFLENALHAFKPLALGHGVMLAGMICNHIFYEGAVLTDFKFQIVIIVVWVLCLAILPLMVFSSQLEEVKRIGEREFGLLASRFTREFEGKWMREKLPENQTALGGDIQSLADLGNSSNVVNNMKLLPVDRNAVIMLAVITLAPIAPLVLTMMPLSEVLKMLAGVLF